MQDKTGFVIPNINFKIRAGNEWQDVTTNQMFKNKRVIVFGLPGAFTPTCSSVHLPRYDELYKYFIKSKIDDIYCVSVNDTFVMNAWSKDLKNENIKLIPDGNGEFTSAIGMLVKKNNLGFGDRSWRYSMLVDNCEIKKMFIEPKVEGDPFEISDADTMLNYIAPNIKINDSALIFSQHDCPFCAKSKKLLANKGYIFEEIVVGNEITRKSIRAVSGKETLPQIFIGGNHIGGLNDLKEYLK